ncbi:MAG: hypothetical protein ACREF1_13690 [Acetobacteraceae bacterium]
MVEGKHNFILVPDASVEVVKPARRIGAGLFDRLRSLTASAPAPLDTDPPSRPRLVFGFDATASREPAWAMARKVTDALVKTLPGELDVALAVHGGSRLHTFTDFTDDGRTLRDLAASIDCEAGHTKLLAILSGALARQGVRVVTYIGDVYEESPSKGRKIADELGRRGIKLFVFHDVSDWNARRDAEIFLDLARRTGGCVLPFDASAPGRLRDLLAAVAVYAVGGAELVHERREQLPGAVALLQGLSPER